MDTSGSLPEQSVYILGRSTSGSMASKFGTLLFSGNMKLMKAAIEELPHSTGVSVRDTQGKKIFAARTSRAVDLNSRLFDSIEDFVTFIKGGLSSYTPSTRQGRLSRVDLVEDSNTYLPIDAQIDFSRLYEEWNGSGLEFDSAFHATGGLYRLSYRGAAPAHQPVGVLQQAN